MTKSMERQEEEEKKRIPRIKRLEVGGKPETVELCFGNPCPNRAMCRKSQGLIKPTSESRFYTHACQGLDSTQGLG